jgi:fatty-acyl-CoA synthase
MSGGSQPPRAFIERYLDEFGVPIVQAWGMTETSPLASVAWPKERMRDWDNKQIIDTARTRAGLRLPGLDITLRDESGATVAFDGETMGDLYVRGPWVVDGYLKGEGAECFTDDDGSAPVSRHRLSGRILRDGRPNQGPHQVRR